MFLYKKTIRKLLLSLNLQPEVGYDTSEAYLGRLSFFRFAHVIGHKFSSCAENRVVNFCDRLLQLLTVELHCSVRLAGLFVHP